MSPAEGDAQPERGAATRQVIINYVANRR